MKKIGYIIKEEIDRFIINEGLSSVLYHFTDINHLVSILSNDTIYLSYSKGIDNFDDRYSYFLSLTRQRDSRLGYSNSYIVRITFDGDLLNNNFHGKAINYFSKGGGKNSYMRRLYKNKFRTNDGTIPDELKYQEDTENEDRLFSNEPTIRNVSRFIKRIDILRRSHSYDKYFKYLINKSIYKGLVHIYDRFNDFNSLKSNDINDEFITDDDISDNFDYLKPQGHEKVVNDYECLIDTLVYKYVQTIYFNHSMTFDFQGYIKFLFNRFCKNIVDYDFNKLSDDSFNLFKNLKDDNMLSDFSSRILQGTIIPSLHMSKDIRFCRMITNMLKNLR